MSNVNIDDEVKKDIEALLKIKKHRVRFQSVKGFIDNACWALLEKIGEEKK